MDVEELAELLFLTSQGIGVVTLNRLKNLAQQKQIQLSELWQKLPKVSYQKLLENSRVLSTTQLVELSTLQETFSPQSYWEYLRSKNIEVVRMADIVDSALIYEFSLPPFLLAKARNKNALTGFHKAKGIPKIGVVGTRAMTAYGEYATHRLTQELVNQSGAMIVSGCMVGVDTVAHQTSLDNGGESIGIVGFGYDHCYPRRYQRVLESWLDQGLILLSEYPPWVAPTKGTFVQRNRLIAILSDTTVVVEAPLKSGALITARFAMEYGKNVGAVPGQIGSRQSEGSHALLQQGAYLVSDVQDILRELPDTVEIKPTPRVNSLTNRIDNLTVIPAISYQQQILLDLLTVHPYSFDALLAQLNQPVEQVTKNIVDLELAGLVHRVAGQWQITVHGYEYLHRPVQ